MNRKDKLMSSSFFIRCEFARQLAESNHLLKATLLIGVIAARVML